MPKNRLDDVLPPVRKSIRDITISKDQKGRSIHVSAKTEVEKEPHEFSSHHRSMVGKKVAHHDFEPEEKETDTADFREYNKKESKSKRYVLWTIATVTVAVFIAVFVGVFNGAVVTLTAKSQVVEPKFSFMASKQLKQGDIQYQTITLTKDAATQLPYTGNKTLNAKASGTITITNNTTSSQKLIANTRVEASNGLVFRLKTAVTIPAKKSGKAGVVKVAVVADEAGENYNIAASSFKIPGLKTTPIKYQNIIGSSDQPMKGGASGVVPIVNQTDLAKSRESLRTALSSELSNEVQVQVPQEFILYPESMTFSYESKPMETLGTSTVKIIEHGTLRAVVLSRADLATLIASKTLPSGDYKNEPVTIPNLNQLKLTFQNLTPEAVEKGTLYGRVDGKATIHWTFNEKEVKQSLKGLSKEEVEPILAKLGAIEKMSLVLKPFWKGHFPEDVSKIKIITRYAQ